MSDGWLQTESREFALQDSLQVMRRKAHPLRPNPSYRGTAPWNVLLARPLPVELLAPVPTLRAVWLEEPRSVESDLSRPLSFSQAPPSSGPIAKRQLSAPSIGLRRFRPVRPARTELPLHEAG